MSAPPRPPYMPEFGPDFDPDDYPLPDVRLNRRQAAASDDGRTYTLREVLEYAWNVREAERRRAAGRKWGG